MPRVGKKWDQEMALPDLESKEYALAGCKFAGRCAYAKDICRSTRPSMLHLNSDHQVLCFKHSNYEVPTGSTPLSVPAAAGGNRSSLNV
ncbi:hypothetical protein [Paenibacillus sp. R14(2021)]|uniref:hypothetical protein n=1 Tax=Paenibacillus sp. R14(2021) TaxID=2859228 RepID=UPI0035BE15D2